MIKKTYLSLPVMAACTQVGGVNLFFVLTIQTQIPTEFPIIDQIDEKKLISILKTLFSNCVLRDTAGRKGLTQNIQVKFLFFGCTIKVVSPVQLFILIHCTVKYLTMDPFIRRIIHILIFPKTDFTTSLHFQ